jgi:hypothetical protein
MKMKLRKFMQQAASYIEIVLSAFLQQETARSELGESEAAAENL